MQKLGGWSGAEGFGCGVEGGCVCVWGGGVVGCSGGGPRGSEAPGSGAGGGGVYRF